MFIQFYQGLSIFLFNSASKGLIRPFTQSPTHVCNIPSFTQSPTPVCKIHPLPNHQHLYARYLPLPNHQHLYARYLPLPNHQHLYARYPPLQDFWNDPLPVHQWCPELCGDGRWLLVREFEDTLYDGQLCACGVQSTEGRPVIHRHPRPYHVTAAIHRTRLKNKQPEQNYLS